MTKKKKPEKPRKSGKKQLRDQMIITKAAAGAKGRELAKEFNLCEQTISEILNSKDAKERRDKVQAQIDAMVPHALRTVFDAIKNGDGLLARDVLRSTGAMQDLKKIEVTGKDGGPVKVEAAVKAELKISLEERVKLLKGEA